MPAVRQPRGGHSRPAALPAFAVWLIVEIEDHLVVSPERPGDRELETRRMVGIGHRLLPGRRGRARRVPVQIENHIEARLIHVDGELAVFVHRQAHGADIPGGHRGYRVRARRPAAPAAAPRRTPAAR